MSIETAAGMALIVLPFVVFSVAMAYADYQYRHRK